MKTHLSTLLLVAAVAVVPSSAIGGMKASQSEIEVKVVQISGNRWRMSGSVMGARNSADNNQHIGCETSVSPGGGVASRNAYCYARTSSMSSPSGVVCATSDAAMIDAIASISDTSYIEIYYDAATAACLNVKITNNSKYATPPVQTGQAVGGFSL